MKDRIIFASLILTLLLSTFVIVSGCGTVAGGGGGGAAAGSPWIYCGSSEGDSIIVINGTTNSVEATVNLGGYNPWNMAASPDGKKIYCSTHNDDVLVIDTATNSTVDVFTVMNSQMSKGMAVSHDGHYLYMTGSLTNEFFRIDLNNNYTYETVALSDYGGRIALNSDSTKAYICVTGQPNPDLTSSPSQSLEVVNLQTMTVEVMITLDNHPWDIMIYNDHAYLAVHSEMHYVDKVDLNTLTVETQFVTPPGYTLMGIVNVPGTNKIYMSNFVLTGEVYPLDPDTLALGTAITSTELSYPTYMAATANYLYVLDASSINHDKIVVIDTNSNEIVKYIYGIKSLGNNNNPIVVYK